jgi:hypothetical protein
MTIIDVPQAAPSFAGWGKFLAAIKRGTIVVALVIAAATAVNGIDIQRKCTGAFRPGFNAGFDRYRCELIIGYIGTDLKFRISFPDWALRGLTQ